MFSGGEPVETVTRAIQGGACDFLLKPLRDKDMHNIWTHVVQWRINAAARKTRSAGVVAGDSDEGGSHGSQQQLRGTEGAYYVTHTNLKRTVKQIAVFSLFLCHHARFGLA